VPEGRSTVSRVLSRPSFDIAVCETSREN